MVFMYLHIGFSSFVLYFFLTSSEKGKNRGKGENKWTALELSHIQCWLCPFSKNRNSRQIESTATKKAVHFPYINRNCFMKYYNSQLGHESERDGAELNAERRKKKGGGGGGGQGGR